MSARVSPGLFWWIAVLPLLRGAEACLLITADQTQSGIAIAGLTFCAWAFWIHGGNQVTAPGVCMFAAALFVFFPGVAPTAGTGLPDIDLTGSLGVGYSVQVVTYFAFWHQYSTQASRTVLVDAPTAKRGLQLGAVLAAVALATPFTPDTLEPFADATAYIGVVLLSTSIMRRRSLVTVGYLVVVAAFYLYAAFVFTGFGRIVLGSLAIALVLTLAHRWRGRLVKAALIMLTPAAVIYLGRQRVELVATLNPSESPDRTGIGSVVGPMYRFQQLLDMQETLPWHWGDTFVASTVVLVPRSLWEGKPVGLGKELADLFRPELRNAGHSELALLHGEFLWNFGILGLIILVPVYGWVINLLGHLGTPRDGYEIASIQSLAKLVMGIVLTVSIIDLVWGGTFTYASRVLPRVAVVSLIILLTLPRHRGSVCAPESRGNPRGSRGWLADTQHL